MFDATFGVLIITLVVVLLVGIVAKLIWGDQQN